MRASLWADQAPALLQLQGRHESKQSTALPTKLLSLRTQQIPCLHYRSRYLFGALKIALLKHWQNQPQRLPRNLWSCWTWSSFPPSFSIRSFQSTSSVPPQWKLNSLLLQCKKTILRLSLLCLWRSCFHSWDQHRKSDWPITRTECWRRWVPRVSNLPKEVTRCT